ncbi:CCN family member 1-like [Aplochiton taeniatus]
MWIVSLAVTLCVSLKWVSASCPRECLCPEEVPRCAPGVSLVLDDCGCCNVCAHQLNEDCSHTEPCDSVKGLKCNFGAGFGRAKGICRAKSDGRPCEYNSKMYQNGESFRPNCKHQCTCMDGAVGCISLCQQELSLPKLGCAQPRVVKVPGRCCEELVCPEKGRAGSSPVKKPRREHGKLKHSENDLTNRNELASMGRGGLNRSFFSLAAFKSDPLGRMVSQGTICVIQTTSWSPCSKTCGPGVSSRLSNSNSQCKLTKESRLCEVRPCSQSPFSSLKKGKTCSLIEKARKPAKLSHAGCHSLKKFRPRHCGSCLDGRCCSPRQTQTVPVRFRCEDGQTFSKDVMMIQSCQCDFNCPESSTRHSAFYRLSLQ